MKSLIIYNYSVEEDAVLLSSFNENCILRNVKDYPTTTSLLNSINKADITNLVFLYHFERRFQLPFYYKTNNKYKYFNDNLINLFKEFPNELTVDILTCNLNDPRFIEEVSNIETDLNINIRFSLNQTGSIRDSDWILESDNVDVKSLYFTENINNWKGSLFFYTNIGVYGTNKLIKDVSGNIIWLHKDISGNNINPKYDSLGNEIKYNSTFGVTWGDGWYGGNHLDSTYGVKGGDLSGIINVYSSDFAYAALKSNGSVVTWGQASSGGNHLDATYGIKSGQSLTNIDRIYSGQNCFAAIQINGNVITWGNALNGGNHLDGTYGIKTGDLSSNVKEIYANMAGFAALKLNGSVITWGDQNGGGNHLDTTYGVKGGNVSSGVVAISSTLNAFAAIKSDGSVVTWGLPEYGGNHLDETYGIKTGDLTSNVIAVYSTDRAFAAVKGDGSVITWGSALYGGNHLDATYGVKGGVVSSGVSRVYSSQMGFAALKSNGSVVTWGTATFGGDHTHNTLGAKGGDLNSGVVTICSNIRAFAALKNDGSVVTWGSQANGGNGTVSYGGSLTSGVKSVFATDYAFAAIKSDGSVVTWGDIYSGGNHTDTENGVGIKPQLGDDLTSNVSTIYSSTIAFAALKTDSTIVAWGDNYVGGDITGGINGGDSSGIQVVFSNNYSFTALKVPQYVAPGGGGDPHIYPIVGNSYFLPHNEKCYLLYDNLKEDRVIITAKCWFLPENIKNNSKFKNHFMKDATFFKYINIYYNGENLTIDMETLRPVKYTNMNDVNKFKLRFIENETSFELTDFMEDKLFFKKYYNSIKQMKYNIDFNGKSRVIKLNNGYEFKLAIDLNCADHRNEIKLLNAKFSNAIGAFISEKTMKVVDCLIPKLN